MAHVGIENCDKREKCSLAMNYLVKCFNNFTMSEFIDTKLNRLRTRKDKELIAHKPLIESQKVQSQLEPNALVQHKLLRRPTEIWEKLKKTRLWKMDFMTIKLTFRLMKQKLQKKHRRSGKKLY